MGVCRYRHERYRATLEACSLVTDLEILEDGDETEIGEKVRRRFRLFCQRSLFSLLRESTFQEARRREV